MTAPHLAGALFLVAAVMYALGYMHGETSAEYRKTRADERLREAFKRGQRR